MKLEAGWGERGGHNVSVNVCVEEEEEEEAS